MMSALKKCLVWDLDDTLWDGVCLEGTVLVRKEAIRALEELDRRGILHSIASRGDEDCALRTLRQNNLDGFFVVPQINWLPKSQNILTIAKELRISLDAIAFIDDDRFEREQVRYMLPDVLTFESSRADVLAGLSEFSPGEITREARERRRHYQDETERKKSASGFATRREFLMSCGMKLRLRHMEEDDIPRVLELMTRTHQLNTTGLMLGRGELCEAFRGGPGGPRIMVAELRDKFGSYGVIGTAIIDAQTSLWRLTYLAVSCRVMGRGIERAFLASLVRGAFDLGWTAAEAEFRPTGRNRMMRALYQMMGFRPIGNSGGSETLLFRIQPGAIPEIPPWMEVE